MKRILYIQYVDPFLWPVLVHGSNLLADKGNKIIFLGSQSVAKSSDRIKMRIHQNIKIKLLGYVSPGLLQKIHYLFFNIWILAHVLIWRPDVVYASEKLVCPIAYLIKKFFGRIKLIYFEPIFLGSDVEIQPKFVREYREKLAAIADLCMLPNEPRLEKFIEDVGDHGNAIFVYNLPRHQEFEEIPMREQNTKEKLKLFCFGHIGADRLPPELFEALEKLKDEVELVIAGIDSGGMENYSSKINEQIKKRSLENNVNLVGLIKKRSDLLEQCSKADVGLAFTGKMTVANIQTKFTTEGDVLVPEFSMAGTSQRPFEYMGLGLVLLVTDLKEWEDFFVKDGYGYSCDSESSESIKDVLLELYQKKDELYEQGKNNKEKILSEWNYNNEFKKVEKYI